ncbi:hypothetical protein BDW74DRAFT_66121 [Aspergillus multicolor]|uniref:uncharacterized protein n=1 Tax=Aspergillus multicolor TaxID=41759 RepID=UPI003CCCD30E
MEKFPRSFEGTGLPDQIIPSGIRTKIRMLQDVDRALSAIRPPGHIYQVLAAISDLSQNSHNGIGGRLSSLGVRLVCFLPGPNTLDATEGLTENEARGLSSWNTYQEQQMQLARELTKSL